MFASLNNWRASPRKFNVLLKAVRGKSALDVVSRLKFMVSPNAGALRKLIMSAVANASQDSSVDVKNLKIAEASVGRGVFMKRVHFKGKGRTGRVTRFSCNVRVVLAEGVEGGK